MQSTCNSPVVEKRQVPVTFSGDLWAQHLAHELVLALQTLLGEILGINDALVLGVGMEFGHLGSGPTELGDVAQNQSETAQSLGVAPSQLNVAATMWVKGLNVIVGHT